MSRSSVVTDDFNRADNADVGASWDPYTSFGSLKIVTNAVRSAAVAGDNRAEGNTTALNNDQYVKAKIAAFSGDHVGVILRGSIGADNNFYLLLARTGAGNTQLYRVAAGVLNSLAFVANPGWAVNDTLELEVVGTTLTAFRNGATIGLSATDANYASGRAGLWINHGGTEANMILDDFEAGNILADPAGSGSTRMGLALKIRL